MKDQSEKRKLLIIDDEEINLKLAQCVLGSVYDVFISTEATEISSMASSLQPDLILLDLHLKGEFGLDVLDSINQDNYISDIPVIMYSVNDDYFNIKAAYSKGAKDYIIKPAKKNELIERIQKVLQN